MASRTMHRSPSRRRRRLAAFMVMSMMTGMALATMAQGQSRPVTLAVDGRSSDNVSIAASGNVVAVTWSAATTGATDIYAATSRDGGASFSSPVRVNATPGEARVNGEMPPRVALVPRASGEPEVVVVWSARDERGWRLLVARSTDLARSFGATTPVPGSDGPGNRGWESVAVDPKGRVIVAWLDHRELASPASTGMQPGAGPTPPADGAKAMRHGGTPHRTSPSAPMSESEIRAGRSQLYLATLGGRAPGAIARSVCYCCKTSLVSSGNDVFAVWRHVFPGNERDIAMSVSRDGGARFAAPVRVSADRWRFDGCPDNGPAIAIDRDRRAHVAWVTPAEGGDPSRMILYHAMSRDGRRFTPRTRIPTTGLPGHAQVTAEPNGDVVLAWDEMGGGGRRVKLARLRVDASERASVLPIAAPEEGDGHHPVVASSSGGTLIAWVRRSTHGGESTIGVAHLR